MTSPGRTSTTGRPGAAARGRPAGPAARRRWRPGLAAAVVVLVVVGTAAALGTRPGPAAPAAPGPAASAAFAVTPPAGWSAGTAQAPPLEVFGVPFVRLAEVPPFSAGGCPVPAAPRGTAAAALVAVPAGTTVEQAAQAFARGAGEAAYAGPPRRSRSARRARGRRGRPTARSRAPGSRRPSAPTAGPAAAPPTPRSASSRCRAPRPGTARPGWRCWCSPPTPAAGRATRSPAGTSRTWRPRPSPRAERRPRRRAAHGAAEIDNSR